MIGELHEQLIAAALSGAEVSFRKLDSFSDSIAVSLVTNKGGQRQKIETALSVKGIRMFNGDLIAHEIRASLEILK